MTFGSETTNLLPIIVRICLHIVGFVLTALCGPVYPMNLISLSLPLPDLSTHLSLLLPFFLQYFAPLGIYISSGHVLVIQKYLLKSY